MHEAFGRLTLAAIGFAVVSAGYHLVGLLNTKDEELASAQANAASLEKFISAESKARLNDGAEASVTDSQTTALQIASADVDAAASGTAYMWIGDGDVTNLADLRTGKLARPSAIKRDARYRVTQNVALRESMPDSENRSGRRIGAVKQDIVVALAEPIEGPKNAQYWLLVRPEYRTTVYLQYATGSPEALRTALAPSYDVPAAQQLDIAKGLNEVRYCRKSDETAANMVARTLAGEVLQKLSMLQIGGDCERVSRPGVVELWIGDPGA